MDSHEHHEFARAQGTRLLCSLPAAIRHSLRHFEVAAVLRPFQPRPPLAGPALSRRFLYAAVTDWSLLLVAMSAKQEASVVLEVPLLLIEDLDVDVLDVHDFVNDSRDTVTDRSTCIYIYPKLTPEQGPHQQQQQHAVMQAPHQQYPSQDGQQQRRPGQQQQQQQWDERKNGQQHPASAPSSPLEKLKHMFQGSSSPRIRLNRAVLHEPPPGSTSHAAGPPSAAAVQHQHFSTAAQQQQRQQELLTRNIIHRLQAPVEQQQHHHHQEQGCQQQQQQRRQVKTRWPQPIAEAVEDSPGVLINGVAGPGDALPSQFKGNSSSSSSSSRMAKLKGRLTVDTVLNTQQTLPASSAQLAVPASMQEQQQQQGQKVPGQQAEEEEQQQQQQECGLLDPSYCLQLITVERSSCLFFHIHRAWIGAHMRAALAAAAAPGLPAWLPPPPNVFQMETKQQQQQQQQLKFQQQHQQHQQQAQQGAAAAESSSLLRGLFRGLGSPRLAGATSSTPAAAGASGGSSAGVVGCSVSSQQLSVFTGSGCSQPAESQAALQADMMRFFGLFRDSSTARKQSGPFPGDSPLGGQQQHQSLKQLPVAPAAAAGAAAGRPGAALAVSGPQSGSIQWENDPMLEDRIRDVRSLWQGPVSAGSPTAVVPLSAFTPLGSASTSPTWAADYAMLMARRTAARRASCPAVTVHAGLGSIREQQQETGPAKPKTPGVTGFTGQQRHMLRAYMQVGAGVYAQHTASATRQLFWDLADGLLRPCSLFDPGDTSQLKQLVLELAFCRQEQVAALQQAFFNSSQVMSFLLARLTSWGTLMNLFPQGLPPIQNPAQPGRLDAWQGRPVVWSSSLMYLGRPRRLMKKLGLMPGSRVCFRSALDTALGIAQKHRQAAERAAQRAHSSSSSLRDVPLGQTYHADPLNLSPLADLSQAYLFVANARRMAFDGTGSEASQDLLHQRPGEPADHSSDEEDPDSSSTDTLAEATNVLRWERLAGRLAARLAGRKVQLLLYWLQMQLSFTEGCSSRRTWLSDKALDPSPSQPSHLSSPWTFRAATQQLLANLLTLHLPDSQGFSSKALIPGGVDDLLWWAQSGSNSWLLDHLTGVLYELLGMCEQEERLGQGAAGGLVMEVIRQVPASHLHPLLRHMFVRFVCLMGGSASSREWVALPPGVAAVLGHKYGCVLLEVLGCVVGAAGQLHDAFNVEVQHIMGAPQVQAQLAAAVAGCRVGVLGSNNSLLLAEVLAAVGAAVPWQRQPHKPAGLTVATLGRTGTTMKVQN